MAMPPPPPAPPASHSRLEEGFRPGGPPPDETVAGFVVIMNVTNTVTHLLLGAVAFCAFICINMLGFLVDMPKLSAHVYLSVIGYVLLLSQAVLSLNPRTGWANNFKYPQKTQLYWAFQVLGSFLAVLGGAMAIIAVSQSSTITISPPTLPPPFPTLPEINIVGTQHLQSAHQIVGLVAMVLTTVSLVGGLANLICTNMFDNSMMKALYSCAVTLSLVIAFIAICLAFDEFRGVIYDTNANMAISFTVFALVGMLAMIIGNVTVGGRVVF